MAIDKLTSTASIIAALRGEASEKGERTRRKNTQTADTSEAQIAKRGDIKVLRQQLADIIKPISLDDKEAVKRARPQVIRSILLWEFGPALREHPEWQPILEIITTAMEQHPAHEANFLKLLSELKR
ncbi:MAG: hypothetical protein ACREO1_06865 [Arenimonas sp.]